jgi:hypothetical protein
MGTAETCFRKTRPQSNCLSRSKGETQVVPFPVRDDFFRDTSEAILRSRTFP